MLFLSLLSVLQYKNYKKKQKDAKAWEEFYLTQDKTCEVFFHSRAQAEFAFVEFSKTIRKTNQITLFCNFFIQFKQACTNSVGFLPQVKMTKFLLSYLSQN